MIAGACVVKMDRNWKYSEGASYQNYCLYLEVGKRRYKGNPNFFCPQIIGKMEFPLTWMG